MDRQPLPLPEFAKQFKRFCKQSDYTMGEVLSEAGIPQQYFSNWLKGEKRVPNYQEVAIMANMLNKPIEVMIYGKKEEPYVIIPKREYDKMVQQLNRRMDKIEDNLDAARNADILDPKRFLV